MGAGARVPGAAAGSPLRCGAEYGGPARADLRVERILQQSLVLRDGSVASAADGMTLGLSVRVIVDETWGFATSPELTPEAASATAERAVAVARTLRAVNSEPVERVDEPVYAGATWVSAYEIDPWSVPTREKIALLAEWSARLLAADGIDHVSASCPQV